ncbi:MAG TPA: metallophosphoesterase [Candidatus Hydrogenedentes bacterium]|nr:metallophosphoesterase [Candidatus Hydrogenedentota bacterium]
MARVCVVSDLHLFCRRSEAHLHARALEQAISESDTCILNGDIVDFRWSVFESMERTVREAIAWLGALVARHPHCHFHYIFGNHDSVRPFIDRLEAFAASTPNLSCHHDLFRLNAAVFLHGDVADRKMTRAEFEAARRVWHFDRKRGRLVNRIYDLAFWLGAHRTVPRIVFPRKAVAERLLHYLDDVGHGRDSGVTDVYYGHTHVAVRGFHYEGMFFHNGGAAMRRVGFSILRATV